MKRKFFLLILCFLFSFEFFSQSQGETLFKQNKPKDAVKVLENEILNGIVSANTYNFLGLGYYQIGEYSKSIDAFERGRKEQPPLSTILTYNQGNTYYAMKDFTSAIRCYSEVIKEDSSYYEAYLNRANALLMSSQLKSAKEEYVEYLLKCPNDKQRPQIEQLINALEKEIKRREEEERLLAENEKAKWEQYDASLEEENDTKNDVLEENKTDWELVEARILDKSKKDDVIKKEESKSDWEKVLFENEESKSLNNKILDERIVDDNEFEKWQSIDNTEKEEIQKLDKISREEHEKWLLEQKRILKEKEQDKLRVENEKKLKSYVEKENEEKELREKIMTEMMKAENERKQKLFEDLTNSLMNSESTNMSSGADDILDYDLEGELD